MRINLPLLPILIDVRWRPLRPFQFSVRGMMLAVAVAGLVFSLAANALRLNEIGNQHASQYAQDFTGVNSDWHALMAQRHMHAGLILGVIFWVSLMTLAALGMVAAFGRVLCSMHQRSGLPPRE